MSLPPLDGTTVFDSEHPALCRVSHCWQICGLGSLDCHQPQHEHQGWAHFTTPWPLNSVWVCEADSRPPCPSSVHHIHHIHQSRAGKISCREHKLLLQLPRGRQRPRGAAAAAAATVGLYLHPCEQVRQSNTQTNAAGQLGDINRRVRWPEETSADAWTHSQKKEDFYWGSLCSFWCSTDMNGPILHMLHCTSFKSQNVFNCHLIVNYCNFPAKTALSDVKQPHTTILILGKDYNVPQ